MNRYQPLTTDDDDSKPHIDSARRKRSRKIRPLHFVLVAVFMLLAYTSLRYFGLYRQCRRLRWGTAKLSTLPTHYQLPSGDSIPSVALGVWQANRGEVGRAVKTALEAGYRHIDDAWIYQNEKEVGEAIRGSGISRKDIWITSKLWNDMHKPDDVETALDDSLQKLGVDYLDLYLIHWPIAFKKEVDTNGKPIIDQDLTDDPYPTWQALERLVDQGKIRNIGVSNFNIRRIQNLTANNLKYKPAVNQVELSYWNPQPELLAWAKENDLLLEAYSPLGSTQQVGKTLNVPAIKDVAEKLGITPAQAVISWHVQRGTIVLPKSVTPSRVIENFQVVKLPDDKFDAIEKAATSHKPKRVIVPNWGIDVFEDEG